MSDQGRPVASTLTGTEGGFLLRAEAPGQYRLQVERIGHETWRSAVLRLGPGDRMVREVALSVRPIGLPDMTVDIGRDCETRPGSAASRWLATAWDEARKALEVTRWASGRSDVRFHLRLWDRLLDARGRPVREDSREVASEAGTSFASLAPERLPSEGFVQRRPDGSYRYFGPDARALLSDEFLSTHCFSSGADSGRARGLLGLRFRPVAGRDVPDVRGTLWLDGSTGELRRLDFEYTGLDSRTGRERPGGHVEFERLPEGLWFVRRWSLRVPDEVRRLRLGRRVVERGHREAGGEVLAVSVPGRDSAVLRRP